MLSEYDAKPDLRKTYELPAPQEYLPAPMEEDDEQEFEIDNLRKAVDWAIPKLNASERAVLDSFVVFVLSRVSLRNLEAHVFNPRV